MKESNFPKINTHLPVNPFEGKTFKVVTKDYHNRIIKEKVVEISSNFDLETVLENIKQYNSESKDDYQMLLTQ